MRLNYACEKRLSIVFCGTYLFGWFFVFLGSLVGTKLLGCLGPGLPRDEAALHPGKVLRGRALFEGGCSRKIAMAKTLASTGISGHFCFETTVNS
jgi:hypothetical protein